MPLRQTYATQLNDPLLAANTIASFTGPQNLIMTTGNAAYVAQPCIIPQGYYKPGTTIRTHASGTFANASTTPTMVIGLYHDTTALGVNAALTETSGATIQMPWWLDLVTVVRSATVPSAVVTFTSGILFYGTSLTVITTPLPIPATTQATVTCDNSAAKELAVKATCGTSAAGNTITLHELIFEEITQI
jgi:hypothetical protein